MHLSVTIRPAVNTLSGERAPAKLEQESFSPKIAAARLRNRRAIDQPVEKAPSGRRRDARSLLRATALAGAEPCWIRVFIPPAKTAVPARASGHAADAPSRARTPFTRAYPCAPVNVALLLNRPLLLVPGRRCNADTGFGLHDFSLRCARSCDVTVRRAQPKEALLS